MAKSVAKTLSSLPKRESFTAAQRKVIDRAMEWMYEQKTVNAPVPTWADVAAALQAEHGVAVSGASLKMRYSREFV